MTAASDTQPKYFPQTSTKVDFAQIEEQVLQFWKERRIFEQSVERRKAAGAPDYVFYDGPPFATGLPHYGHILTSYIKDTIPRFFTMQGRTVPRRFGWDCHGLPIENEIEKDLEISGKRAIEEFGIDKFNARCREAVQRYTGEWERIITRLGRWVDFEHDYKTLDLDYMESVLRVFSELFKKGLIYEGAKVVPYCYRCQTPLSNFETRLDDSFRDKQDPSVTVRMKILREGASAARPEYILVWTTTPWTLPSNVALAVGPEIEYQLWRADDGDYWLASARLAAYQKEFEGAQPLKKVSGAELIGLKYEPLFPYFAAFRKENAFRIVGSPIVSTEDGTGVVHIAPAFGEEDFEIGQQEKLPLPCPVDSLGCFTAEVSDFAGQNVHEANKGILKLLKEQGKLARHDTMVHGYPHCWRDDTPLIYKTVSSWFVNVTAIKDKMLAANQRINWVPENIRDGRFGKWLENARDWAISRSRFWGAPIPVWKCDKTGEVFVPSSLAELSQKWGQPVTDLHRPFIDEVTFPSPAGGTFRRVPDVLDCWFESGSMPYAQVHYPFENKEWFEKNFPADFIVEYIAQTRGWFYTLVVLAAGLRDCHPFKNCICHGVVLAEDGRKMSKRLKNYPDPEQIVGQFGSDALRVALLASPIVRGGNLNFAQKYVEQALRDFLIPIWNAFHFLATYGNIDGWAADEVAFTPHGQLENRSDRFILAKLEETRQEVEEQTRAYNIVGAYDALRSFIDTLNNWYIRLNRRRFWGPGLPAEKCAGYETLFSALKEFSLIAAPFLPFISETIYQGLCGAEQSVHLQDWPAEQPARRNHELVAEVDTVREIIFIGRQVREQQKIKIRQPLQDLLIYGAPEGLLEKYAEELRGELNVKNVAPLKELGGKVNQEYKPNARLLGPRLGPQFKDVMNAARNNAVKPLDGGRIELAGVTLEPDEFELQSRVLEAGSGCASNGRLVVLLTLVITPELLAEGISRELTRSIQELRKELDLNYTERIAVRLRGIEREQTLAAAVQRHRETIMQETLAAVLEFETGETVHSIDSVHNVRNVHQPERTASCKVLLLEREIEIQIQRAQGGS